MIRSAVRLLVVCLIIVIAASIGYSQDFEKTYKIEPGGQIKIHTVSGSIIVTGYDGDSIIATAYKVGRERDRLEVADNSNGNKIDLDSKYPVGATAAGIDFKLQVPRAIKYSYDQLSTASGEVRVENASGDFILNSASGSIIVKGVTGSVVARTASSNIDVEIVKLEGFRKLVFESGGGSVNVKMPASLDANILISTNSGSLKTDFSLPVVEAPLNDRGNRSGPAFSAHGVLGSGSRQMLINSNTGNVSLLKL
jgi:DUF4097 and DUF4098 domain-containing protein YvlB